MTPERTLVPGLPPLVRYVRARSRGVFRRGSGLAASVRRAANSLAQRCFRPPLARSVLGIDATSRRVIDLVWLGQSSRTGDGGIDWPGETPAATVPPQAPAGRAMAGGRPEVLPSNSRPQLEARRPRVEPSASRPSGPPPSRETREAVMRKGMPTRSPADQRQPAAGTVLPPMTPAQGPIAVQPSGPHVESAPLAQSPSEAHPTTLVRPLEVSAEVPPTVVPGSVPPVTGNGSAASLIDGTQPAEPPPATPLPHTIERPAVSAAPVKPAPTVEAEPAQVIGTQPVPGGPKDVGTNMPATPVARPEASSPMSPPQRQPSLDGKTGPVLPATGMPQMTVEVEKIGPPVRATPAAAVEAAIAAVERRPAVTDEAAPSAPRPSTAAEKPAGLRSRLSSARVQVARFVRRLRPTHPRPPASMPPPRVPPSQTSTVESPRPTAERKATEASVQPPLEIEAPESTTESAISEPAGAVEMAPSTAAPTATPVAAPDATGETASEAATSRDAPLLPPPQMHPQPREAAIGHAAISSVPLVRPAPPPLGLAMRRGRPLAPLARRPVDLVAARMEAPVQSPSRATGATGSAGASSALELPLTPQVVRRTPSVSSGAASTSSSGTAAAAGSATGETTSTEEAERESPDIADIAENVYRIIRRRLAVERERRLGLS